MTLGTMFLTFLMILCVVGLCALFVWASRKLGASEMVTRFAEVAIVIVGVAAIVFVVLPRLGIAV